MSSTALLPSTPEKCANKTKHWRCAIYEIAVVVVCAVLIQQVYVHGNEDCELYSDDSIRLILFPYLLCLPKESNKEKARCHDR